MWLLLMVSIQLSTVRRLYQSVCLASTVYIYLYFTMKVEQSRERKNGQHTETDRQTANTQLSVQGAHLSETYYNNSTKVYTLEHLIAMIFIN